MHDETTRQAARKRRRSLIADLARLAWLLCLLMPNQVGTGSEHPVLPQVGRCIDYSLASLGQLRGEWRQATRSNIAIVLAATGKQALAARMITELPAEAREAVVRLAAEHIASINDEASTWAFTKALLPHDLALDVMIQATGSQISADWQRKNLKPNSKLSPSSLILLGRFDQARGLVGNGVGPLQILAEELADSGDGARLVEFLAAAASDDQDLRYGEIAVRLLCHGEADLASQVARCLHGKKQRAEATAMVAKLRRLLRATDRSRPFDLKFELALTPSHSVLKTRWLLRIGRRLRLRGDLPQARIVLRRCAAALEKIQSAGDVKSEFSVAAMKYRLRQELAVELARAGDVKGSLAAVASPTCSEVQMIAQLFRPDTAAHLEFAIQSNRLPREKAVFASALAASLVSRSGRQLPLAWIAIEPRSGPWEERFPGHIRRGGWAMARSGEALIYAVTNIKKDVVSTEGAVLGRVDALKIVRVATDFPQAIGRIVSTALQLEEPDFQLALIDSCRVFGTAATVRPALKHIANTASKPSVLAAALRAYAEFDGDFSESPFPRVIQQLLSGRPRDFVGVAARATGQARLKKCIPDLIDITRNGTSTQRLQGAIGLRDIGYRKDAVKTFRDLLADASQEVVAGAITELSTTKGDFAEDIQALAVDGRPLVALRANALLLRRTDNLRYAHLIVDTIRRTNSDELQMVGVSSLGRTDEGRGLLLDIAEERETRQLHRVISSYLRSETANQRGKH